MFGFIIKMFLRLLSTCTSAKCGGSLASNCKGHIKCVNRFTANVNKCGGSCNIIDDPYARICIPNKVNNINGRVINLMLRVNKTRFLVQH